VSSRPITTNVVSSRPITTNVVSSSEWLLLAIFQLYNGKIEEQVNFQWYDDEVRFVLDQHADLDFYSSSSMKQQSAGRHVAPLGHIILIPRQPVFALTP